MGGRGKRGTAGRKDPRPSEIPEPASPGRRGQLHHTKQNPDSLARRREHRRDPPDRLDAGSSPCPCGILPTKLVGSSNSSSGRLKPSLSSAPSRQPTGVIGAPHSGHARARGGTSSPQDGADLGVLGRRDERSAAVLQLPSWFRSILRDFPQDSCFRAQMRFNGRFRMSDNFEMTRHLRCLCAYRRASGGVSLTCRPHSKAFRGRGPHGRARFLEH